MNYHPVLGRKPPAVLAGLESSIQIAGLRFVRRAIGESLRWGRAEKLEAGGNDLGTLAFAVAFLRLVLPSAQSTFDENLTSFLEMLGADFAEAGKGYNRMPFHSFLFRSLFVSARFIGRDREVHDGLPGRQKYVSGSLPR